VKVNIGLFYSNDSIELSGILQRSLDHANAWNVCHFLFLLQEVKSVTPYLPRSPIRLLLFIHLLVLLNEFHQLCLVINHEHLLHVCEFEAIVGALS